MGLRYWENYWQLCFEEKASTCIFILDTNRRSGVTDSLVEWKHQVCLVWDKDIYMLIFFYLHRQQQKQQVCSSVHNTYGYIICVILNNNNSHSSLFKFCTITAHISNLCTLYVHHIWWRLRSRLDFDCICTFDGYIFSS